MSRVLLVVPALALLLSSCSTGPDQSLVVENIASEGLIPLIETAADEVTALQTAIESGCPGGDLDGIANAWRSAATAYEAVNATAPFGPASMARTTSMVDYQPISPTGIDDLLASDEIVDADYLENRSSSTRRGLGSIEYVLFDIAAECEYAAAAAEVATSATMELRSAWLESFEGAAPFIDAFTADMTSPEALGDVVGAFVETLKEQQLFELGAATGSTSQEANVDAIPEGALGFGSGRYLAELAAIETVLKAGGESGLLALIESRDASVATDIDGLLAEAQDRMSAFSMPLQEVAETTPTQIDAYLEVISELRSLLEADVVSLLDITLGFSDSDGDTG